MDEVEQREAGGDQAPEAVVPRNGGGEYGDRELQRGEKEREPEQGDERVERGRGVQHGECSVARLELEQGGQHALCGDDIMHGVSLRFTQDRQETSSRDGGDGETQRSRGDRGRQIIDHGLQYFASSY